MSTTDELGPRSDVPTELAQEFVALSEYLQVGGDTDGALQRLARLAADTLDACDAAAITAWPQGKKPRTLAASSDSAAALDHLQYELGEGPCMMAAHDAEVYAVDFRDDRQWPTLAGRVMKETPVRGALSFFLVFEPVRSALNLYTTNPSLLHHQDSISTAGLFAAHARVLLMHAEANEDTANLQKALGTSRQIGAAIGILMNAHKVSEEQAFALLRTSSQHLNRKLRDIADDVRLTGQLPDEG